MLNHLDPSIIWSLQTEGTRFFPVHHYRYPVHPKYALSKIVVLFFLYFAFNNSERMSLRFISVSLFQRKKIIAHLDIWVITVKVHGLTSISVSRFEGQCLIGSFKRSLPGLPKRPRISTTLNWYDLVVHWPTWISSKFIPFRRLLYEV